MLQKLRPNNELSIKKFMAEWTVKPRISLEMKGNLKNDPLGPFAPSSFKTIIQ